VIASCSKHTHDVKFKHAAVIIDHSKQAAAIGFNYSVGTSSVHAEMAAVENFFAKHKIYKRKCVL
jgi:hypothetical protein